MIKLEDYLRAIRECPDEEVDFSIEIEPKGREPRLTVDWGIADNFPILLKADTDGVIKYLKDTGNYFHFYTNMRMGVTYLFNFVQGTVRVAVSSILIDKNYLTSSYFTSITLHPYQDKKIDGIDDARALAMVVDNIGQFILEENIPAIMPNSAGDGYIDTDYSSRIVVHEPVGPIKSDYLRLKNQ